MPIALLTLIGLPCVPADEASHKANEADRKRRERLLASSHDFREISVDEAKALSQHTGRLALNGLTTLSDEAAAALLANPLISLPDKFKR